MIASSSLLLLLSLCKNFNVAHYSKSIKGINTKLGILAHHDKLKLQDKGHNSESCIVLATPTYLIWCSCCTVTVMLIFDIVMLQCIYGSKETFDLMHCLEELTKDRQYLSTDLDTDVSLQHFISHKTQCMSVIKPFNKRH